MSKEKLAKAVICFYAGLILLIIYLLVAWGIPFAANDGRIGGFFFVVSGIIHFVIGSIALVWWADSVLDPPHHGC